MNLLNLLLGKRPPSPRPGSKKAKRLALRETLAKSGMGAKPKPNPRSKSTSFKNLPNPKSPTK